MLNFFAPPNEARGIFHKKLLGIAASFIPGGGIAVDLLGGVVSRIASNKAGKRAGAATKFPAGVVGLDRTNPREFHNAACIAEFGSMRFDWSACGDRRRAAGGGGAVVPRSIAPRSQECRIPFQKWDPISKSCQFMLGDQVGPNGGQQPTANGRPGAPPVGHTSLIPDVTTGTKLRCPKRYVLGIDNLCYFGLARNSKFRKWRPGRRPLFTGGDLNAIARTEKLADSAEDIFKITNPAKKAVARSYRANWRKPLKK